MPKNINYSILFITTGGINKPSTRERVLNYTPILRKDKYRVEVIDISFRRIGAILRSIFSIPKFDVIFFQKVYKNKIYLFYIAKLFQKHIVFDIDDAIQYKFASNEYSQNKPQLELAIKLSDLVIVGNSFLFDYVRKLNSNVKIIPTPLSKEKYKVRKKVKDRVTTVGWVGTSKNQFNLLPLLDGIAKISKKHNIKLLICSDKLIIPSYPFVEFIKWKLESQNEVFDQIDVGIMPLTQNKWNEGKCSFKLLEYLFCGIPSVASSVGMNMQVIQDGYNGYLARDNSEFIEKLAKLISDSKTYNKIRENTRKSVVRNYDASETYAKLKLSLKSFTN